MSTSHSTAPGRDASAVAGPPTLRLGAAEAGTTVVLGRYRLQRRLGAGGFGVVWQAHDAKLERDVAVKVVPRQNGSSGGSRVMREALAAARLNHPGIVALYELGSDDHDVYLVSELVQGATLEDLAREGALSDRDVARIGGALCDALEHAHARGVVHRDVKPANVMVLAEPAAGAGFAKLTDFGIAHLMGGDGLTATGDVVGTLAYMAPEQADGGRVTGACDVYSLALTLYEAWAGANPVRRESPAATARCVGRPVPPLHSRRRDLPPELCEVVDAALDADPFYRPPPAELREVLAESEQELSDEGGLVEPATVERFGLTAVRTRTRLRTLLHRGATRPGEGEVSGHPRRVLGRIAPRVLSGGAAGALTLAALESLAAGTPASASALAAATALLVALLPRAGWLAVAAGLCVWLASPGVGRPGTALVLGCALAFVPLLLPRAGLLWSVPAMAPLLGAVGLAPLFVGVAALASTAWRRAGLAAAGFLWLAVAEIATGRELLFGAPDETLARAAWEGSFAGAAGDALYPLASSPAVAPAIAWALSAGVFGVLVRGRWPALDIPVGAAWVVGLVAAHGALGGLLAATTQLSEARGAVAGAALGGILAVTARLVGLPGEDRAGTLNRAHFDSEAQLP